MSHPDQSPAALRFGCPACQQELSIPASLAGVEGPCPHCHAKIAAPVPSAGLPARHLDAPAAPAAPVSPPAAPVSIPPISEPPVAPSPPRVVSQPPVEAAPVSRVEVPNQQPEVRQVVCQACGCELAIDPSMAHLPGGPCPRCQTWIDLSGNSREPEPAVPVAPTAAAAQQAVPPPAELSSSPSARRRGPSSVDEAGLGGAELSSGPVSELNQPGSPDSGMDFPKLENLDQPEPSRGERRKRRKRKRQLPPEFYVGHAANELDARGQESAGKMRRNRFPDEGGGERVRPEPEGGESRLASLLPVFFGILIPLLAGLFAALHFDVVKAEDLRFWERKGGDVIGDDGLAKSVEQTGAQLSGKAKLAYEGTVRAFNGFFDADTWEEAEPFLSDAHMPPNSEAMTFLKVFPREAYRGASVKVIDFARIPKTERFIFTTHVSNGINDVGENLITFLVGEEQPQGASKIHALQLFQSWKGTLTEFMETSGADGGRFYAELRIAEGESELSLPDDGDYVKLEMKDLLVERYWTKEVYVRKDSYAGTRLLNTLSENFSQAVVDLEWLQGPSGDAFIHVAGIHASNWGDFPK